MKFRNGIWIMCATIMKAQNSIHKSKILALIWIAGVKFGIQFKLSNVGLDTCHSMMKNKALTP